MEAQVTKEPPFPISDAEKALIIEHRADAAAHEPLRLADLAPAKVNALSRSELQVLLDRVMRGEVER